MISPSISRLRATQEIGGLSRIVSLAVDGERECFQSRGRLSFVQEQPVQAEKNCSAVDASGKRTPIGAAGILRGEPSAQLAVNSLDVVTADEIEILWKRAARRIEEAPMHWIGIRASDEAQRRDVMRGHHSRVARMELVRPSMPRELRGDFVDALADDENWSVGGFREEVSHRSVETSREHDALSFLRDEGESAIDGENFVGVAGEQAGVERRIRSIDHSRCESSEIRLMTRLIGYAMRGET